ncbi:siderophore-interacting protein [Corynebacterium sp. 13CS0277]|uniref:siderophore-interacting protein n=1 Tax=Corynebacterium sp. 13CS0277 TaxID=2071994 RepID=UPI000D0456B9|nr:siderophore-interacting protein [Corynebacterium sp. 13CS0277]PRQ10964.1 siderophore-interacting protein [Corynebacterium sp. 13CS0277]
MRTSRTMDIFPISLRDLEVVRVDDITPLLRRVVFAGPQLAGYDYEGYAVPPLVSAGFDDDVRIVFPDPATGERPAPVVLGDGNLAWPPGLNDLFRTYTVRAFDAAAGELTIDFARHAQGLAEDWSENVQVGDRVYIAGPKMSSSLPVHRGAVVVAGDETALPAIARFLEESAAESVPCRAVIAVREDAAIHDLVHGPHAQVRWVRAPREGDVAEGLRAALEEIRTLQGGGEQVDAYVWVAGEAGELKRCRAVVKDFHIARGDAEFTGYWRDVTPTRDAEGRPRAATAMMMQLFELAEVAPGLALRAAVQLGVFRHLSAPRSVEDLASDVGVAPEELARLLRFLHTLELVEYTPPSEEQPQAQVRTTALGGELADPESMVAQFLGSPFGFQDLALVDLVQALRGELTPAAPVASPRADVEAGWVAPAVAAHLATRLPAEQGGRITVTGPGAGVYQEELARKLVHAHVETTDQADIPAEVALLVDPLTHLPAAEATALIAGVRAERLVVVTDILHEVGGEEHDYEKDLVLLCTTGARVPTARDVARVAADAGYAIAADTPVGWGKHVLHLMLLGERSADAH